MSLLFSLDNIFFTYSFDKSNYLDVLRKCILEITHILFLVRIISIYVLHSKKVHGK